jgi:hypothetical protein
MVASFSDLHIGREPGSRLQARGVLIIEKEGIGAVFRKGV